MPLLSGEREGRRTDAAGARSRDSPTRSSPAEILVDPIVKITVVEYHSRPISVMGAVRRPITFQADGVVTLLDALSRAEGLTDDAGPEILVTQNDAVHHIPVKKLLDGADPNGEFAFDGQRRGSRARGGQDLCSGQHPQTGRFFGPRPGRQDGAQNDRFKRRIDAF